MEKDQLKQLTIRNIFFLSLRNIGIQLVSVIGFFILTILLGTGEVGLFAIVSESIGILGYFSDMGLASAIIQKKSAPSTQELRTTFTIQQLVVITGLLIVTSLYIPLALSKGYGPKENLIFASLCLSFFIASLKTIPSVILERKLNFKTVSSIDIVENFLFYSLAVVFALLGYQGYSYAIAVSIRSLAGLVLIYRFSPWPLGLAFSLPVAKSLFKYGIPFQLNTLIAMAKDRLSSLLVASIIGREGFGLVSWGQKATRLPLGFMDAIMKVTFPTFSRLQDQKEILRQSISRTIHFMSFLVFPMLAGICFVAPDIVTAIPKYSKWSPALFPLYLLSLNAAIAVITTPLTNAFNATGNIRKTTKYMIMWTVLTWLFYPSLSLFFGYRGTAVATLLVGLSSLLVWIDAHRTFGVNIFRIISLPLLSTLFMSFVIMLLTTFPLSPYQSLLLKPSIGLAVFVTFEYLYDRQLFLWLVRHTIWVIFQR